MEIWMKGQRERQKVKQENVLHWSRLDSRSSNQEGYSDVELKRKALAFNESELT